MHVLITGANGFLGQALTRRLCAAACPDLPADISRLTLLDVAHDPLPEPGGDDRIVRLTGCVTDAAILERAVEPLPDIVFHLAAIPSGRAEEDLELGMRVNLHGSLQLLQRLCGPARPRVVLASSIGVYGTPLPAHIDDDTPIRPTLSYGAQKRALELILGDYSRRGLLQGIALRLPGIVIRPGADNGAWSLFSSHLIGSLARGRPVTVPVGREATVWLMSLPRCLDNLLLAASMPQPAETADIAWTLPCLRVSVQQIIDHFEAISPGGADHLVRIDVRPGIQEQFGNYPPLETAAALARGFQPDAHLAELVQRSLCSFPPLTYNPETP